jgi:general secretion pathway protein A
MYISYYGLKAEPFRLTPDPQFLHLSETHQAALTVVVESILYRKGLVMITGPIGTGKTTILNAALQMLTDASKEQMPIRSAFLFNPTLSPDEFLEMILDDFRVVCPSTSKSGRLMALYKMLMETQSMGGTAVLFIDEAHLLSTQLLEEIRLLGNADTHQAKMLQIVLCGQTELAHFMNGKELEALKQRIAGHAILRPLNFQESHDYVAERLHLAGLKDESPFSADALVAGCSSLNKFDLRRVSGARLSHSEENFPGRYGRGSCSLPGANSVFLAREEDRQGTAALERYASEATRRHHDRSDEAKPLSTIGLDWSGKRL